MASYAHDHTERGFEPGCPACELAEVSMQDTGRPWTARIIQQPTANPTPVQRIERGAA